MTKSQTSN